MLICQHKIPPAPPYYQYLRRRLNYCKTSTTTGCAGWTTVILAVFRGQQSYWLCLGDNSHTGSVCLCVWGGGGGEGATVVLAVWGTAIILAVWVGQQSYWLCGLDNSHTGCMGDNSHIDCVCVGGGGGGSRTGCGVGGQQSYWLCMGGNSNTGCVWEIIRPPLWEHCHTGCVRTLSHQLCGNTVILLV